MDILETPSSVGYPMRGKGVYSLPEAARLTHLKIGRVREWFRGSQVPVFRGDYRVIDGDRAISFLDLVELFVGGQLREKGLSLQRLRKVHKHLQIKWDTHHPFCHQEVRLSHDGKQVFTCGLDEQGRTEVIEVLKDQRVFVETILPFLQKIDYDKATKIAIRWHIGDKVVIDPEIRYGKPIIEGVGISTAILANAYAANGKDAEIVANWFGTEAKFVIAAVNFERKISGDAA